MTDSLDKTARAAGSGQPLARRPNWLPLLVGLAAIGLGVVLFRGVVGRENAEGEKGRGRRPVPVRTAVASRRSVPVEIPGVGNVEAFSTVVVRPQIEGQLLAVHFQQGQRVTRGELLFTIDDRTLRAQIAQAEATVRRDRSAVASARAAVERDRAQLRTARTQTERYRQLLDTGAVSREQFDQVRTAAEALTATLQASEAAVENALAAVRADEAAVRVLRVQLGFTRILAPVDGRAGSLGAYPGNLVRPADPAALVTILRTRPIYVSFNLPERYLNDVRRGLASGGLAVTATPSGSTRSSRGRLVFLDNTADATTGTIRLRGQFENADDFLLPGQFVNTVLSLRTIDNAVVVPSQAVQVGQQGQYVFVVGADQTVESRPVRSELNWAGLAVIASGLSPGETVVTDGQLQLVPGTKVQPKKAGAGAQ